ncbi:hypothetical protein SCHPADRAFT_499802 [Schizopora paradoxa]|uniref:Cytochrome P450 n=1 Tax=Schizopora paradoxa TaxID=27342 RepID=A0A0H2RGV2_9AGAM|nr:hypothetical protein SCHPADRAFT_499802 [Schizopora paradoxa]
MATGSSAQSQLNTLWLSLAFLLSASLIYYRLRVIRARKLGAFPLPPGPRRLPIIGNLHQIPPSCLWETASQWRKEYGDLIYLEAAGKPMLLLNSYEDAEELLGNRSAIYSSRPHTVPRCMVATGRPALRYGCSTLQCNRAKCNAGPEARDRKLAHLRPNFAHLSIISAQLLDRYALRAPN